MPPKWTALRLRRSRQFGGPPRRTSATSTSAFAAAPVKIDATYTTPDQAHAMMEPHATIAAWDGDRLTCWTSIQQMNWGTRDLAIMLDIPRENVRLISPFIGGGFGGKGTVQSDLGACGALAPGRRSGRSRSPCSDRSCSTIRSIGPQTIQRIRLARRVTAS